MCEASDHSRSTRARCPRDYLVVHSFHTVFGGLALGGKLLHIISDWQELKLGVRVGRVGEEREATEREGWIREDWQEDSKSQKLFWMKLLDTNSHQLYGKRLAAILLYRRLIAIWEK